jgi:Tfp pilus assembly PilM family ATPase
MVDAFVKSLLNEIRYSLQAYERMEAKENGKVEKIILTGGSAHLPHVARALSQALNMNVYLGDPWARVVFPEALRPVLDEVGPRLAVSIGLAMREIE